MNSYLSQKEAVLLDRINKAKQQLESLHKKKKYQLGELAFQYGLHQYSNQQLSYAFEKLSKSLGEYHD